MVEGFNEAKLDFLPLVTINIHPLISKVVFSKLATLYELQEIYTITDLFDFVEIIDVFAENDHRAHEAMKKKSKLQR